MAEKGIKLAFPVSIIITSLITLAIYAKGGGRKTNDHLNCYVNNKVEAKIIPDGMEVAT